VGTMEIVGICSGYYCGLYAEKVLVIVQAEVGMTNEKTED
jgi:hypothetical protein